MMTLLAIHRGRVADIPATGSDAWWDKPWRTGFSKQPALTAVPLHAHGLDGDEQADLVNHGGSDKAVCAYPAGHYPLWRRSPELAGLPHGAFGENFTLDGADESAVCIGDVFEVGTAIVQISQPRQPCWKLARRWRVKDLAARVERSGRTGWYFRVLLAGLVTPGDALHLRERPHPEWTIALANEIMHHRKHDAGAARHLAACPALSAGWQHALSARAGENPPQKR